MAKQGYEHEEESLTGKQKKVPLYVSYASWAFVALSLLLMYKFTDNRSNRGQIEFGWYLLNSVTFGLVGLYFYFLFVRINYHNRNAMELKIVSLFAGLATLARLIIVIYSDLYSHLGNLKMNLYTGIEIVVWFALTVFFFLYWWKMHDYDFDGEYGSGDDDE